MFESNEMVVEIATSRIGRVSLSGAVGSAPKVTVYFLDGKPPYIKDFSDLSEFRSVQPIDEDGQPRLIPERPVI